MAKKFVKKTDKQKKIAKFPEHMKDSFDETISKYNNLGSATILGIIPPRDGTRETAHIIKTLNQMAKRRKRIEEIAAQFKYFEDVIDRLTVSKDGLYWDDEKILYKPLCRVIENEYNLQFGSGSKVLFAAIEAYNIGWYVKD